MSKSRSLSDYTNDLSIPGQKLEDNAITTSKIEDEAITQDKLDPGLSLPIPDDSIEDDKISPTAGIASSKLNFAAQGSLVRPVQDKLEDYINVKDYGAKGNGTDDDTQAFLAAVEAARAISGIVYFPAGTYLIKEGTPVGAAVGVVGAGIASTVINLDFSTLQYFLDFNSSPGRRPIRDFTVIGTENYGIGGLEQFLNNSFAPVTVIENVSFNKLRKGINLVNSWGSLLRNLGASYVDSPIRMTKANGAAIKDIYVIRYFNTGILIQEGLSTQIKNVILEYGFSSTAISLLATHNALIEGFYTEGKAGGSHIDIGLYQKNQKSCLNTTIRDGWPNASNTASDRIIVASAYKGLTVENIAMQTPGLVPYVIQAGSAPIYVGNICQFDQNANGFIGDFRGTGQALIPIASDNSKVLVTNPHPSVGNGTQADLANLANHTVPDSNGLLPGLYPPPSDYKANVPSGLTCSGAGTTFGAESSGISLYSKDYGSATLIINGVITSSGAPATFSKFRITNSTRGDSIETGIIGTGTSGDPYTLTISVNLSPGQNDLTLAMTREQGGGGSNTFTVSDYSIS